MIDPVIHGGKEGLPKLCSELDVVIDQGRVVALGAIECKSHMHHTLHTQAHCGVLHTLRSDAGGVLQRL